AARAPPPPVAVVVPHPAVVAGLVPPEVIVPAHGPEERAAHVEAEPVVAAAVPVRVAMPVVLVPVEHSVALTPDPQADVRDEARVAESVVDQFRVLSEAADRPSAADGSGAAVAAAGMPGLGPVPFAGAAPDGAATGLSGASDGAATGFAGTSADGAM